MAKGDLKKTLDALEYEFLAVAVIAHRCKFNYYKTKDALKRLEERGLAISEIRPRGVYWKKVAKENDSNEEVEAIEVVA